METIKVEFDNLSDEQFKYLHGLLNLANSVKGLTWRYTESGQSAECLSITDLKSVLRDKEKKAVLKIKAYSLQKWYWQETGEEYDFTNAGNNELIFGVTGDFKAVVRKLNLPNYSKYIDKILYAFEGLHRELIQKDDE